MTFHYARLFLVAAFRISRRYRSTFDFSRLSMTTRRHFRSHPRNRRLLRKEEFAALVISPSTRPFAEPFSPRIEPSHRVVFPNGGQVLRASPLLWCGDVVQYSSLVLRALVCLLASLRDKSEAAGPIEPARKPA